MSSGASEETLVVCRCKMPSQVAVVAKAALLFVLDTLRC